MNQNSLETDDTRLGEIVDEILSRMGRGENLEIDAYVAQYPEFAAILRQALPALNAIADSASGVGIDEPNGFLGNRLLGDFRIRRELGRGGMGVVYEADQISLQRRVALKVLPFAGVVREQALLRFQNEVRAAATLDHPNIVAVYSVGEERGVHYYAMQLVRGQSMSAVIAELNRLRSTEGVPLSACTLEQILSGQQGAASVLHAADAAVTEGRGKKMGRG